MGIVTYPHQRVVNVRREPINADFLGIKNENWQYAARDLKPFGCMLYLYLASNRNNYKLALSPAAVRQAIGMAQSTYRDQFNVLLEKGYLVQTGGNTFDFYEKPRAAARENEETRAAFDYNTSAADLNENEQTANNIDYNVDDESDNESRKLICLKCIRPKFLQKVHFNIPPMYFLFILIL